MALWNFPEDFLWGTATSNYQVEGAVSEDGRGRGIWDTFCHTPGKVAHGHNADIACDQFHLYKNDVALMRELGVKAYRFSISWPRVFPDGKGRINPKGFDYYHSLIDALLEAGIEPAVTLYHWDLPQTLQDMGGWPHRDIAKYFAEYAAVCFDELGEKVKFWMTLNELTCASYSSYESGKLAPGIRGDGQASFSAAHHLLLGHGLAVRAYRDTGQDGQIGVACDVNGARAATRAEEDILAADRARDGWGGRFFLNPLFGKSYPQRFLQAYPKRRLPVEDGDMEIIGAGLDFLGVNMYKEFAIAHDPSHPEGYRRVRTGYSKTSLDWDINPRQLYRVLKWVNDEYDCPAIYVTENGSAFPDKLSDDGLCHDPERIEYIRGYIAACAEAMQEGVDLRGYFLWSFIDNFEWGCGFTKRFGLVYCDYDNECSRIPKDSFYFYREVIAGYE